MAKQMGAPRKELNFEDIDMLCAVHCTGEEIASFCKVTYPTLLARVKEQVKDDGTHYKTFLEYYAVKSASGKISLRRMQWNAANKGNINMMIWLGKNVLGQTDKQQIDLSQDTDFHIDFDPEPD